MDVIIYQWVWSIMFSFCCVQQIVFVWNWKGWTWRPSQNHFAWCIERGKKTRQTEWDGDLAQLVRLAWTVMLLTQVWYHDAARDFLHRVGLQCRLSFGVHTPSCAIACVNTCVHDKNPLVQVRVWWFMAKQTYPAHTIDDKNNQLDDCGRSTERRRTPRLNSFHHQQY